MRVASSKRAPAVTLAGLSARLGQRLPLRELSYAAPEGRSRRYRAPPPGASFERPRAMPESCCAPNSPRCGSKHVRWPGHLIIRMSRRLETVCLRTSPRFLQAIQRRACASHADCRMARDAGGRNEVIYASGLVARRAAGPPVVCDCGDRRVLRRHDRVGYKPVCPLRVCLATPAGVRARRTERKHDRVGDSNLRLALRASRGSPPRDLPQRDGARLARHPHRTSAARPTSCGVRDVRRRVEAPLRVLRVARLRHASLRFAPNLAPDAQARRVG